MFKLENTNIFQNIVLEISDGIVAIDDRGIIRFCNPSAASLFGWEKAALENKPLNVLLPKNYKSKHAKHLRDFATGGERARYMGAREANILGRRHDGSEISLGITILKTSVNQAPVFVAVMRDLSERFRIQKELERLANTDPLTEALNRRAFERNAERELSASGLNRSPNCLLLFDLDHFKIINDRYGHEIGDVVICEFAEILKKSLRSSDLCSRWGGEEFMVLLPKVSLSKAVSAAERIRKRVNHFTFASGQGQNLKVTVSAGVACDEGVTIPLNALISVADQALYSAKARGRNNVVSADIYSSLNLLLESSRIESNLSVRQA